MKRGGNRRTVLCKAKPGEAIDAGLSHPAGCVDRCSERPDGPKASGAEKREELLLTRCSRHQLWVVQYWPAWFDSELSLGMQIRLQGQFDLRPGGYTAGDFV